MRLVIDANILFSALIKNSKTRQIIKQKSIELVAPKELIQEFKAHKKEILKKSGISGKQFLKISRALLDLIKVQEKNSYLPFLEKAISICPDKKDSPYFALCLKERISLWSNDSKLKKQEFVYVYPTKELLEKLAEKEKTMPKRLFGAHPQLKEFKRQEGEFHNL